MASSGESIGTQSDSPPRTSPEATYEDINVHQVYEAIAPHFSSTRYKPWPFIATFLEELPAGSVGLDVGCGNGKYLAVNPNVYLIGSDRSAALVGLARNHGGKGRGEVMVADGLALPFRGQGADFVICIAVIHHLSTAERRRDGVRQLLECVRPGGKVLVYVWALEQGSSRRGWDDGAEQDQLVPWVMKGGSRFARQQQQSSTADGGQQSAQPDTTYHRYYHLYKKGELEEDVAAAGGEVLGSGYEKDNWWVICTTTTKP
jgi:tRNA (uracil-5-)-methyltransferase TRM9